MARFSQGRTGWLSIFAFAAALVAMLVPREAKAQRELLTPTGGRGQLAIDQISGFRAGTGPYGPSVNYWGPLGFAYQSYSQDTGNPGQSAAVHLTTFWIAPSADFFVIDHLSIGGLVQVATTSGSTDLTTNGVTQTNSLDSITTFTFLPRVGWLFALGDRWGIWPRGGLGFTSVGVPANISGITPPPGGTVTSANVHGLVLDVDCGFIFRVNETFFLRAAPEFGWLPAGAHTVNFSNGGSTSFNASYWQFTGTFGIGVLLDL